MIFCLLIFITCLLVCLQGATIQDLPAKLLATATRYLDGDDVQNLLASSLQIRKLTLDGLKFNRAQMVDWNINILSIRALLNIEHIKAIDKLILSLANGDDLSKSPTVFRDVASILIDFQYTRNGHGQWLYSCCKTVDEYSSGNVPIKFQRATYELKCNHRDLSQYLPSQLKSVLQIINFNQGNIVKFTAILLIYTEQDDDDGGKIIVPLCADSIISKQHRLPPQIGKRLRQAWRVVDPIIKLSKLAFVSYGCALLMQECQL